MGLASRVEGEKSGGQTAGRSCLRSLMKKVCSAFVLLSLMRFLRNSSSITALPLPLHNHLLRRNKVCLLLSSNEVLTIRLPLNNGLAISSN